MTLLSLRGRLQAASVRAILLFGVAASFALSSPASAAPAVSPPWAVVFGAEFWKLSATRTSALSSHDNLSLPPSPVTLGRAIERAQHALQPSSTTGWSVRGRGYFTSISPPGLRFQTTAGDDEALTAVTSRIQQGNRTLSTALDEPAPWHIVGNTAQRLRDEALGLVEHVEAGAAGVEVSWVLSRPPETAGDLIITWDLVGRARPVANGNGWRLAGNSERAAVLISETIAVDSAGRRTRLTTQAEGQGLRIVVPGTLLRNADYPLAIDPLISAEFDLDQPVVSGAPSAQFAPAIASDGTNYLVAWHDNRNGPMLDLFAARVTTNGALLDPSGFAITTATNDQWYPAIAFNGTHYLVTWQDGRNGGQDIYAARVTPTGQVIETNGLAVVTAGNDQRVPAATSLNGDFLVVWQDGRNGAANQDIYAARITGTGALVETNGFLVNNANNSQSAPAVGVVGTNYLAAWHDFRSGVSLDTYAGRITRTGSVLDSSGIIVSALVNDQWNVAIAGNGTTGLITWQDGRNGVDEDIFGARISESGAVLDPGGLAISQQPNQQRHPAVIPLGSGFYVAWQDNRVGPDFNVHGTTVTAGSGAVGASDATLISDAANDQRFPALASSGGQLLVVWEDIRNGVNTDIFGSRLNAGGGALDAGGLLVSTVANAQETPAIASNGSLYLAVWRDYRNDPLGDIYGARILADGALLDPAGLAICTAGNYQLAPQVAASGSDFLVVWQDFRNGAHDDVLGSRVSSGGVIADPTSLLITTALGVQSAPAVAGNSNGYLVAWQDRRTGANNDIYATRVSPNGAVQDLNGLAICSAVEDQKAPSAAGLGDGFFLAWEDFRGSVSNRIYGARVPWNGSPNVVNGFALSALEGEQQAPRVAAGLAQFLVVWQGRTNSTSFNVYGTRVSATGLVQDTNSIAINTVSGDQTHPTVAARGDNFMVVWEDQRVTGFTNLYSARLTPNATVLDVAGELTAPDHGRNQHPALAYAGSSFLLVYQTRDVGNVARARGVRLFPLTIPTISLSPGAAQFVSSGGPILIDPTAVLVDAAGVSWESGTVTIDLIANASSSDRLGIRHQGSAAGEIGVSGNSVSHGGVLVGYFTGGTSGASPLLVIFNGATTTAAVEALLRNVTFNNVSGSPFTQPRTVRFNLGLIAGAGDPAARAIAVIDANTLPSILAQPVAQTVSGGSAVTLSVVASGSQPLRYQWRLNGVNIDGATGDTYRIDNFALAAAGNYTVVVSNDLGSLTSDGAALNYFALEMYAGLTVAGPAGAVYRVEWRPALDENAAWTALTNVTLSGSAQLFIDVNSSRQNQRYYRMIPEN